MAIMLGVFPEQRPVEMRDQMREWLQDGVSLMAEDENTGRVIGMRGALVIER